MRVLGVDTGMTRIGWGIVDREGAGLPQLVDFGLWSPQSQYQRMNSQTVDKLRKQYVDTVEVIHRHKVTHLAIELVPVKAMSQGAKVLATQNMMRCIAIEYGLHYRELPARTVKKQATGDSKASKERMKEQVFRIFPEMPNVRKMPADVYDAILIAEVASSMRTNWWLPVHFRHAGGR